MFYYDYFLIKFSKSYLFCGVQNYQPVNGLNYTLNQVELVLSGDAYFNALLAEIDRATQLIHLQVYIFDWDTTGLTVFSALERAVIRGVKVFVVVDAYASHQLNEEALHKFSDAGIRVKLFSPLKNKKGWGLGRRLHHKLVWIDGNVAFVGGINIADKYSGFNRQQPWLDFAVKLVGPICTEIKYVCDEAWPRKYRKELRIKSSYTTKKEEVLARVTRNDWLRARSEISRSYRQAFLHAHQSITIVASYFLPGNRMRKIIRQAAERGVQIQVVLVGDSDVPLVKPAMTYLYDWMFRHGIVVYEWKKSVLHGKLALVDNKWVTVGSYNLNALSDYGSLELNVEVFDTKFAYKTQAVLNQLISDGAAQIHPQKYLSDKGLFAQLVRWMSYTIIRLSLRLLFVLMQGRKTSTY